MHLRMEAGQQVTFVWQHNGKVCPFVHFTDPKLVKGVSDYAAIENDLKRVRECFELLRSLGEEGNPATANCVLANALVTYGRVFTTSEQRGVTLDGNAVYQGEPECLATHEWLMKLRHGFFCHAGGTEYESVMVYLALHPDGKTGPLEVYRGHVAAASFELGYVDKVVTTLNSASAWVRKKLEKSLSRMKELIAELPIEDLYAQAIHPDRMEKEVVRLVVNAK